MLQVMLNLLSNAVKYTPDNGMILIATEKTAETLKIKVVDNGYGIPAWAQEKVFQKFFQADYIMADKVGGAGLGLSISEGIVKQHQGKLYCSSPVPEDEFPVLPLGAVAQYAHRRNHFHRRARACEGCDVPRRGQHHRLPRA